MNAFDESIRIQIDELHVQPDVPLILCDADEVLFQFLRGLEGHLEKEGYFLDLVSFALAGNIKHAESGEAVTRERVAELLAGFFASRTAHLEPVEGAAEALANLSHESQIVVLTNTPPERREMRAEALRKGGMPYPVIANKGPKGAAAAAIAEGHKAPAVFIDDIPPNIDAVLDAVPHAHGIHMVADPRLRPLIPKAPRATHRVDEWHEAEPLIAALLKG